ncbi:MAG: alpha/beta hydrolase-fold protein [Rhodocyclaceae bacterium]
MKTLLACLFCLATVAAHAAPVALSRSEEFITHSERTGKDYRIQVALPDGPAPAGGYPVVYVLDADLIFNTVVETMRIQARKPDATGVRPALIVGIAYPAQDNPIARRAVDYTPSPVALPIPEMSAAMRNLGGGADDFLAFLHDELRGVIAHRHAIDPSRQALFGHSLGGLFVLHALFARPDAFTDYIAASPSWWWNDALMRKTEAAFSARPATGTQRRRLLLTVGEFEQKPSRFSDNMPGGMDTLRQRGMVDNVHALAKRLADVPGLTVQDHEIAGENHLSSIPQAINHALRFALEP